MLNLFDFMRQAEEKKKEAAALVASLPQLPSPPEALKLPCGDVSKLKDLNIAVLPRGRFSEAFATDVQWRMHACPQSDLTSATQHALESYFVRCLGDAGLDLKGETDHERLRRHLQSHEHNYVLLNSDHEVCLFQDGYIMGHGTLLFHKAPLALAAWRLRQRGVKHTYKTYTNEDEGKFDVDCWYTWRGSLHAHRDVADMLCIPYKPPSSFMQWRAKLASSFCRAALRFGISHKKWYRYPILEYLREVTSLTTPQRPYTQLERSCVEGGPHDGVCRVHPLHMLAHSAVWTLWSATWTWSPWRICKRLIGAINARGGPLPEVAQKVVIDYLGGEFTQDIFLTPGDPFDLEQLDSWQWWWDVWYDPCASVGEVPTNAAWELPGTPEICTPSPTMDVVTQEIEHVEPAAHRDSDMAAWQAYQDWADHVQQRIHFQSSILPLVDGTPAPEGQSVDVHSDPMSYMHHHCFLPSTLVRVSTGAEDILLVSDLQPSMCLRGGLGAALVKHVRTHDTRDRDIVGLHFINDRTGITGSLHITSSQHLPTLQPNALSFKALPAADIKVQDLVRTLDGEATVIDVKQIVQTISAIEVEFEDNRSTMLVADPSVVPSFVEVYGELAPPPSDDYVKILSFRRCTNFKEALLTGAALETCRRDLENHGFSADLAQHDLGPGKMFVAPSLANRTLRALGQRGVHLNASHVVVSRSFEAAVLDVALHIHGARPNHVLREAPLDLSRLTTLWITTDPIEAAGRNVVVVERTFLKLQPAIPSDARSVVTMSTTDAHSNTRNPRLVAERFRWD